MKKIPLRTCCVTREKCEKRDLIRIVRMPSGEVKVDDSWDKYEKWLKKKKDEEDKLYE